MVRSHMRHSEGMESLGFPGGAVVKNPPVNAWTQSLGWEDPLEEEMETHSSILAWRIPRRRSLEACSPWGLTELGASKQWSMESDMTERRN